MIMRPLIALTLFMAQPANAGCFLFFYSRHGHHRFHNHHHYVRTIIVKKIIIVHERKADPIDRTPISPLK
jgi:hypothetical protein